jgi:hypothetical protein
MRPARRSRKRSLSAIRWTGLKPRGCRSAWATPIPHPDRALARVGPGWAHRKCAPAHPACLLRGVTCRQTSSSESAGFLEVVGPFVGRTWATGKWSARTSEHDELAQEQAEVVGEEYERATGTAQGRRGWAEAVGRTAVARRHQTGRSGRRRSRRHEGRSDSMTPRGVTAVRGGRPSGAARLGGRGGLKRCPRSGPLAVRRYRLQAAPLLEAHVAARFAEHQVVEHLDPKKLASSREPARQGHVLGAGLGVARTVVMADDQACSRPAPQASSPRAPQALT